MPGTKNNRNSRSSLRPGHVRAVALPATIVGVVVLPIAAAEAKPLHGSSSQPSVSGTPATAAPAVADALTPQYCGSTDSGFQGQVTEQACVDNTSGTVTGTVYVGNSTDKALTVAINLTRADGSIANMSCTVAAHDANGVCTTGPLDVSAGKGAFDAIAEAVPVNSPVSLGVLHVESGKVAESAATAQDGTGTGAGSASTAAAAASPAA